MISNPYWVCLMSAYNKGGAWGLTQNLVLPRAPRKLEKALLGASDWTTAVTRRAAACCQVIL